MNDEHFMALMQLIGSAGEGGILLAIIWILSGVFKTAIIIGGLLLMIHIIMNLLLRIDEDEIAIKAIAKALNTTSRDRQYISQLAILAIRKSDS